MDLGRNNLGESDSLYLRQHSDNPIHWQEWGPPVTREAAKRRRPIFVSVGYSSCHWCHVMAAKAFSDRATANFLNEHFICVKVDREERPDIDHYLMEFLVQTAGSGGWPLNAFMTWDMRPIHALTYAPTKPKLGMPTFLDVARGVEDALASGQEIKNFTPSEVRSQGLDRQRVAQLLERMFDHDYGGFGRSHKFPPHSTLLYMLCSLFESPGSSMEPMTRKTLDAMMLGGLNDHLQGGVFRYCVDREWTIPHFEKMLYDQGMALWVYSLAFKVLGNEQYRDMSVKILDGLEAQFLRGGLYLNSLDADTNHSEGATYLWDPEEIESRLGSEGLARFSLAYNLPPEGNFDGRTHLTRKSALPVPDLESRLLQYRKSRVQPGADEKFLSGNNCLAICALVQSSQHLGMPELLEKAEKSMEEVLDKFWNGKSLARVMSNGNVKPAAFLPDSAAALLAMAMLVEHDSSWGDRMSDMEAHVRGFRDGDNWLESRETDFHSVPAARYDQPTPSGVSMAEVSMAKLAIMSGKAPPKFPFYLPHSHDFHNIAALASAGGCPIL